MRTEPKRVPKHPSPALFIGLGGSGSDMLLHIKDKFLQRFILPKNPDGSLADAPERTAYLEFDTDLDDVRKRRVNETAFKNVEALELQIPSTLGDGSTPDYVRSWWDSELDGLKIKNGAGGIRQAGRYVFFYNANLIREKLKTTIGNLIQIPGAERMESLEIILCSGVSGGTGSGIFLDMAYLSRSVMQEDYAGVDYDFMAYLVMPEVNLNSGAVLTDAVRNRIPTNGFAAIKELDFWMNYYTHEYTYEQRYSSNIKVKWNNKPFDFVTLLGNKLEDGHIIPNAYETCMETLSESVLNFFANEAGDGNFALRSHLSNVVNDSEYLNKTYPGNYAYMTIGSAVSDIQQEAMLVYEVKLTTERLIKLKTIDKVKLVDSHNAAPLLNTDDGDAFLVAVYPENTSYYKLFKKEYIQDQSEFTDLLDGSISQAEFRKNYGEFHTDGLESWTATCKVKALEFAVKEVNELRKRFRETTSKYVTDLTFGPFSVAEFLADEDVGFVGFFGRIIEKFKKEKIDAEGTYQNLESVVKQQYNDAQNDNLFKVATEWIGLNQAVKTYVQTCQKMYNAARKIAVADAFIAELKDMQVEINAYCRNIFPAFCKMIELIASESSSEWTKVSGEEQPNAIISVEQLRDYVSKAFGDAQQVETSKKLLHAMLVESQSIKVNKLGEPEGIKAAQASFERAMERFVAEAAQIVNGVTMDDMLTRAMPDKTDAEKVQFVSNKLLPNLQNAAKTMLPLIDGDVAAAGNEFLVYPYAGVPENAVILQEGVSDYGTRHKVTPKPSQITDRLYWLNTYNCVPMFMYAELPGYESKYTQHAGTARGLHLVSSAKGSTRSLRNDWSLLPSPVLHELKKKEKPTAVKASQDKIHAMMDEALKNGAAVIEALPDRQIQLSARLRRHEGHFETLEELEKRIYDIETDATKTPEERKDELEALRNETAPSVYTFKDYSQQFADAHELTIHTQPDATRLEKEQAQANLEAARQMATEYILYAWYPHVAERMIAQQQSHVVLQAAIDRAQDAIGIKDAVKRFTEKFMLLYLTDMFIFQRTKICIKDVNGNERTLIERDKFNEDEKKIYRDYCKAMALMMVLSGNDGRVNPTDLHYLMDKAGDIDLDKMSDEEYEVLKKNAERFLSENAKMADTIKYDREGFSEVMRESTIERLRWMMNAAKDFIVS